MTRSSIPRSRPGGRTGAVRGTRGAAIVEFAVVSPLLVLLLVGTIDFGRVFYTAMALTNAARAGAQYGSYSNGRSTSIPGMRTAAQNSASPDVGTITATQTFYCECGAPPNVQKFNSCIDETCGTAARVYVDITTTKTFSLVAPLAGVPSTVAVTRHFLIRSQ